MRKTVFSLKSNNTKHLFGLNIILLAVLSACADNPGKPAENPKPMALLDGLGKHQYPITVAKPAAQRYFNQGMVLAYGFNHSEAVKSFQAAYGIDPACAMCYWGEALALGPNINAPMAPAAVPQAVQALRQAEALAVNAGAKEKALIAALSTRYQAPPPADRKALDEAYAAAMVKISKSFPDDAVIAALTAEALMDLHPWNFWTKQGQAQPWTQDIVDHLERALALDADNPLANHLYIHALEASPNAEKALPAARRLPGLAPGAGHLVHMPAHIYIRTGRYRDAIAANQQATQIDHHYVSHDHAESIYTLAYVPHNYHFLWSAALKVGRKQLALNSANDTAAHVKQDMLRDPILGATLQHFQLLPLYTHVLFGDWDNVMQTPPPPSDLLYQTAVWHYARGMALLRKGQLEQAKADCKQLKAIINNPAIEPLTIFGLNAIKPVLQIADAMLLGELAAQQKYFKSAISHLERAVQLEDSLNYTEPKDWYLPPRQVLGAMLLESGQARKAEAVYKQDLVYHPQNGWSLFGLNQSLQKQGKKHEAEAVWQQFQQIWADADIGLKGSRF